jgi:hypothetical protein
MKMEDSAALWIWLVVKFPGWLIDDGGLVPFFTSLVAGAGQGGTEAGLSWGVVTKIFYYDYRER